MKKPVHWHQRTGFLILIGILGATFFASHISPTIGLVPIACGEYSLYLDIHGFPWVALPNER
tara:strand:+ start:481 stop:666 length:186 start_codon:yes stop_codon:yes gene_type:complete